MSFRQILVVLDRTALGGSYGQAPRGVEECTDYARAPLGIPLRQ